MVAWSRDAVRLVRRLFEQNLDLYRSFATFRAHTLSLVRADGALDLYDGGLRAMRCVGADDLRPRRLQPLLGAHRRGREGLVVHEVPVPQAARRRGRLVPGRAADARDALRLHPHAARRSRAPRIPRLRRRACRRIDARLPLGAHDRDAARRRSDQGPAARRRPARPGPDVDRQARRPRRRRDRSPARHADPSLPRRRERPGGAGQPDRLDHAQQPGDERRHPRGRAQVPRRPRADRRPAQSHRGRGARVRPVPVLRDPRGRQDAAVGAARRACDGTVVHGLERGG